MVVPCGSCSPTRRGSAGSTARGHAGRRPRSDPRSLPNSFASTSICTVDCLSRKFARSHILLVLDGAPNHRCRDLVLPDNISLLFLPPYSPELNPKENVWHEIREKIFKNYALKSIDAVRAKLEQAILYLEHNPDIVKSITGFPYIIKSL